MCVSEEALVGGLTVPPRYWIPSTPSSSSIPAIPTTYTFLSLGSFVTEEMYTAAAYADPNISSYVPPRPSVHETREFVGFILTTCASTPSLSNLPLYILLDCVALFVTNITFLSSWDLIVSFIRSSCMIRLSLHITLTFGTQVC